METVHLTPLRRTLSSSP